jgi:hypothetical protein
MAKDRDQWQDLVSMILNLYIISCLPKELSNSQGWLIWGWQVFVEERQNSVYTTVIVTNKETSESMQEQKVAILTRIFIAHVFQYCGSTCSQFTQWTPVFFQYSQPLSIIPVRVVFLQVLLIFPDPKKITHKIFVQLHHACHSLEYCFPVSVTLNSWSWPTIFPKW